MRLGRSDRRTRRPQPRRRRVSLPVTYVVARDADFENRRVLALENWVLSCIRAIDSFVPEMRADLS